MMSNTTAPAHGRHQTVKRRRSAINNGQSPRNEGRRCLDRCQIRRLFNEPRSGLDAIDDAKDDEAENLPLLNNVEAADGVTLGTYPALLPLQLPPSDDLEEGAAAF